MSSLVFREYAKEYLMINVRHEEYRSCMSKCEYKIGIFIVEMS